VLKKLGFVLIVLLTIWVPLEVDAYAYSVNTPIDLYAYVACANNGAGELVYLSGTVHDIVQGTFDSNGGLHFSLQTNPQEVSGVGLTTGDKYQGTGVTRSDLNVIVGFEETYVNNFRIIGQGSGNNFLVHENMHLTVTANFEITADVDNVSVECQ
jgi:hypothetical protein